MASNERNYHPQQKRSPAAATRDEVFPTDSSVKIWFLNLNFAAVETSSIHFIKLRRQHELVDAFVPDCRSVLPTPYPSELTFRRGITSPRCL